jgi:hypothetical protein
MDTPTPADPGLIDLARFSREENERVRGMLAALWHTRPRAIQEELFR